MFFFCFYVEGANKIHSEGKVPAADSSKIQIRSLRSSAKNQQKIKVTPPGCLYSIDGNKVILDREFFGSSRSMSSSSSINSSQVLPPECSFFSITTTAGSSNYSLSKQFRPSRALPPIEQEEEDSGWPLPPQPEQNSTSAAPLFLLFDKQSRTRPSAIKGNNESAKNSPATPGKITNIVVEANNTSSWTSVVEVTSSTMYFPLFPIIVTAILSATFFVNSAREQFGGGTNTAADLFAALSPLSFASGILLGWLCDVMGPLVVMYSMNGLSLLQFVLLLASSVAKHTSLIIAAAVVSSVNASFFLTQFYCYIALTFPNCFNRFGTLSGISVMCSGLFSLIVTPMCDFSSFASNYAPMNALCLALTATNLIFLYVLYRSGQPAVEEEERRRMAAIARPRNRSSFCSV